MDDKYPKCHNDCPIVHAAWNVVINPGFGGFQMDVLADFLKTAVVTAQVDPSPLVDQDWSQPGMATFGSTGTRI